jgi:hypothetical protein
VKKKKTATVVEAPPKWRNRITHFGEVDPKELLANPRNFRLHPKPQQAAMTDVLDTVGWVSVAAIINERTKFVVDGHLRVSLALARGEERIPVAFVDLTDEEELLILASFDAISSNASTDSDKLADLLRTVDTFGFETDSLDTMFSSMLSESQQTEMKDTDSGANGDSGRTGLGTFGGSLNRFGTGAEIKPVLFATEIRIFEEALRRTGEHNRGKALIQICQQYLDANPATTP